MDLLGASVILSVSELRQSMRAGEVKKVGGAKYEVYMRAGGKGRKVVIVDYEEEIGGITGAEGR